MAEQVPALLSREQESGIVAAILSRVFDTEVALQHLMRDVGNQVSSSIDQNLA